jgi:regulatory protein
MLRQGPLSAEQALQRLRHYCDYQERCHQEVKDKLYSFGLRKQDVETAIATLIQEDRLNEERFAVQFAGGRFRLKNWGKIKIRYELQKGFEPDRIAAAIATL